MEEVGLAVEVAQALPAVTHDYAHGRVELHPFRCLLAGQGPQTPQSRQVADWRWVPAGELRELAWPPANGPILDSLLVNLSA